MAKREELDYECVPRSKVDIVEGATVRTCRIAEMRK